MKPFSFVLFFLLITLIPQKAVAYYYQGDIEVITNLASPYQTHIYLRANEYYSYYPNRLYGDISDYRGWKSMTIAQAIMNEVVHNKKYEVRYSKCLNVKKYGRYGTWTWGSPYIDVVVTHCNGNYCLLTGGSGAGNIPTYAGSCRW